MINGLHLDYGIQKIGFQRKNSIMLKVIVFTTVHRHCSSVFLWFCRFPEFEGGGSENRNNCFYGFLAYVILKSAMNQTKQIHNRAENTQEIHSVDRCQTCPKSNLLIQLEKRKGSSSFPKE